MSVAYAPRGAQAVTPEDLLALPDGKGYELVGGRLVERNVGAESSWIGGRLFVRLSVHCEAEGLGWVWPADNGYQCFPHDATRVRRPDVSYVAAGRLPGGGPPRGLLRVAPDLAVEVVSPRDLAGELEGKLEDYRRAGVPLVWVIYPEGRMVRVLSGGGPERRLGEWDELDGGDVVPGFRCRVADLFPPTPTPPPPGQGSEGEPPAP